MEPYSSSSSWSRPVSLEPWLPLQGEPIWQVVERQAEAYGDRAALVFEDVVYSYADIARQAHRAANALAAAGVRRGDRVALLMENCPEHIVLWLGAALVGSIHVPINAANRGEFLRHQLATAGARAIICDQSLLPRLQELLPSLPELEQVFVREDQSEGSFAPAGVTGTLAEFLNVSGQPPQLAGRPAAGDVSSIFFTSGTTGPSKGAALSHNYLVFAARENWRCREGTEADVTYTPLPLFHTNALCNTFLGSLLHGGRAVIDRRFSVSRFWQRASEVQATQISVLGSMITMLWNRPASAEDRDHQVRVLVGAPMPPAIHHQFEERFGLRAVIIYGLSEAMPLTLSTASQPAPPGSSGRRHPLFDVRLFDADDLEVPPDAPGEVVCRARQPHGMLEHYWGNPEATVEAMRNGWFHTGDIGRFDADGNFYFLDRRKDVVRRRGETIASYEVEQVLMLHPAVDDAAVVGVPSDLGEEDVKAVVVLAAGAGFDPLALVRHCEQRMPYFAVPRYLEPAAELPRSPVGRVLKFKLREAGNGPQTWDREAHGVEVRR
jgi:crotonobetaine/carnitine-CoA ligase